MRAGGCGASLPQLEVAQVFGELENSFTLSAVSMRDRPYGPVFVFHHRQVGLEFFGEVGRAPREEYEFKRDISRPRGIAQGGRGGFVARGDACARNLEVALQGAEVRLDSEAFELGFPRLLPHGCNYARKLIGIAVCALCGNLGGAHVWLKQHVGGLVQRGEKPLFCREDVEPDGALE